MNPLASQAAPAGPTLQDIHMPPTPSWWPLTPAWWIVIAVVLVLLGVAMYYVWRWRRRHRAWRTITNVIDALETNYQETQDAALLASGLSQLLRRAVLLRGGQAHLHGAAWHAELSRLAPDKLSTSLLAELSNAQYQTQATLDGEQAIHSCRSWLHHVLRRAYA